MNKWLRIFTGICAAAFVAAPLFVFAEEVRVPLEVGIGSRVTIAGEGGTTAVLVDYIAVVYEFIVGAVGIIAAVVIMYWGFRWITAAGNQTIIGNAKEGIVSALIGLVLSLTSYTVLAFISPSFVSLQSSDVAPVTFDESVAAVATSNFSAVNCDDVGINFQESLPANLKEHLNISITGSKPCTTGASYTALVAALTELDNENSPYYGMKMDISSGYRTYEFQYELFSCERANEHSDITIPSCPPFYIKSDGTRYYLNTDGTAGSIEPTRGYTPQTVTPDASAQQVSCGQCTGGAAAPGTSSHETGYAIDVAWFPDPNITNPNAFYADLKSGRRNVPWHAGCFKLSSAEAASGAVHSTGCTDDEYNSVLNFDTFMQNSGFKRICKEWWHFETTDSSGSWCSPGDYST